MEMIVEIVVVSRWLVGRNKGLRLTVLGSFGGPPAARMQPIVALIKVHLLILLLLLLQDH